MANTCFYSISVTIWKFHWFVVNSWYKKELWFGKKKRNAKNLKIKFQQRPVKQKCSIDKKTKLLPILDQSDHQNLNVEMYFYVSAIISRDKFALVDLFLMT